MQLARTIELSLKVRQTFSKKLQEAGLIPYMIAYIFFRELL